MRKIIKLLLVNISQTKPDIRAIKKMLKNTKDPKKNAAIQ
jgi:hypothetical protein